MVLKNIPIIFKKSQKCHLVCDYFFFFFLKFKYSFHGINNFHKYHELFIPKYH